MKYLQLLLGVSILLIILFGLFPSISLPFEWWSIDNVRDPFGRALLVLVAVSGIILVYDAVKHL